MEPPPAAPRPYFVLVTPGFEDVASEEITEKVSTTDLKKEAPGVLSFISDSPVSKLRRLRSIDYLYALVTRVDDLALHATCLPLLENLPAQISWDLALVSWRESFRDEFSREPPAQPTFRATCDRTGVSQRFEGDAQLTQTGKHTGFNSPDVEQHIGCGVEAALQLKVSLKKFDVEVYASLNGEHLLLGLALQKEALFERHRWEMGRTALIPSIAYCMLRLAQVQEGQVLCDPFCGSGSIPLAVDVYRDIYIYGSDLDEVIDKTRVNIVRSQTSRVEAMRADATALPFRDNSIDLFISDMPFGRRSGSATGNRKMYPKAFREMFRTLRVGGSCVLLTIERNLMHQTFQQQPFWKVESEREAFMSGLRVYLYILRKEQTSTDITSPHAVVYETRQQRKEKRSQRRKQQKNNQTPSESSYPANI